YSLLRMRHPDIARPRIARPFAKSCLGIIGIIYNHREVVAIRGTKASRRQVGIAWHKARDTHSGAKIYSTICTIAEEDIPGSSTRIHPANAHVTRTLSNCNGRETMFN